MTLFMRWLSRWPLAWLHTLGAVLGWATWALSPSYRRRLNANAALAGLSVAQRRQSIAEAGRLVAEVPWLWFMPPGERLGDRVRWHGEALIVDALAAGRGVLLLTPHLGSFEVAARAAAERFARPITVLYRPARKAALREMEETARARPNMATAPASLAGVRQLLRALKRGEIVGLLPDQVPPLGQGVWAPFFGKPAYTMTLAARLAQQTGAAVGLAWCERLPRGEGYSIHLSPLDQRLPADQADDVGAASVINASMERAIRALPTQYLWGYNRYKSPRKLKPGEGG
ncbi:MAG TPA: lysophospholipid acyltransferase family protein [Ideonella sp.]|uniref:lysophospholipid acyltransferase family protein n=1 Tax=Ideonella sp. TaxID=1929293 RepID=UPI002E2F029F|nr:lysophospholipid acyltransferase family protein [Ideonella sp.]HEX5682887.1 lysophospholipid acyltransferase family protein [Ideonella sp.]